MFDFGLGATSQKVGNRRAIGAAVPQGGPRNEGTQAFLDEESSRVDEIPRWTAVSQSSFAWERGVRGRTLSSLMMKEGSMRSTALF